MINFQAESKLSGDEFESKVEADLISRGFTNIEKNVCIQLAGCEIDFIADGYEYCECKGGNPGHKKRPGALRTDNVKKAIASGALIKYYNPHINYVIYFSAKPKLNSYSDRSLKTAVISGIVDEIRYLE